MPLSLAKSSESKLAELGDARDGRERGDDGGDERGDEGGDAMTAKGTDRRVKRNKQKEKLQKVLGSVERLKARNFEKKRRFKNHTHHTHTHTHKEEKSLYPATP